jgi:hypothetical protein
MIFVIPLFSFTLLLPSRLSAFALAVSSFLLLSLGLCLRWTEAAVS